MTTKDGKNMGLKEKKVRVHEPLDSIDTYEEVSQNTNSLPDTYDTSDVQGPEKINVRSAMDAQ
eukprot:Ihof_evm1s65 gene=Ihof_evmTU1s65